MRGAPNKYDKTRNDEIIELMSEGASIVEVAGLLGVSRGTVYNWMDENHASFQPEFLDTIKIGLTKSQVWWEEKGRKNLDNTKFNPTLWIMNMTNRFRQDWKNRNQLEHTGSDDAPLRFEQIVVNKKKE